MHAKLVEHMERLERALVRTELQIRHARKLQGMKVGTGHAPLPQEATKLAKVQRVLRFPSCWSEVLACHACPQLRPMVDACMVAVNSWSYVDRRSNVDGPASGWVGACVNGVCGRMRPPKPNLLCMIAGESSGVGETLESISSNGTCTSHTHSVRIPYRLFCGTTANGKRLESSR